MLVWIILWIAIAMVIGAIANGKGHSGFGWFIYALLLWPIALIHVLAVKPNQRVLEREALATGNAKKCPHCGEMVRPEATVCRFCQRDLPPIPAPRR